MLSFKQYLTESANTHLIHLEDLAFEGSDRVEEGIDFLEELAKMLGGNSKSKVNATVKWDGCVHEDTVIKTNEGDMTIKEIVELENPNLSVFGKIDIEAENNNTSNILNKVAQNGNKTWVEVFLENGSSIKLTEDHEVHTTNRGWVKAGELNSDDNITEM